MARNLLLIASLALPLSACSVYSPADQPMSQTTVAAGSVASISLSATNAMMIREHYADSSRGNGRGRNGRLPPGIERNLQRGKPLPPGIAKQHLPQELLNAGLIHGIGEMTHADQQAGAGVLTRHPNNLSPR